ncbi:MAG: hypothetical protein BWY78_00319 [Alphaproteobacteria bacterium ADurb.Bin438]|nr:MAG: hypothetical protein BWY78_00319 [Alphaproteobacteria bacterium ADurb.Bin438]
MTQNITDYANNSSLSNACYANLVINKEKFNKIVDEKDKNDFVYNTYKTALIDNKFTELQASDFLNRYEISYHYPNDETGLSFTVFKEKATGKLTLACRGTEMETDFISDAAIADADLAMFSNIATHQTIN